MNSPHSSDPTPLEPEIFVTRQCDRHGEYQARQLPGVLGNAPFILGCGKCSEERQARAARDREETEQRQRREQIAQAFGRSNIPLRFRERSFDNYRADVPAQRTALTIARKFAKSVIDAEPRGASLVLCGSPGTGKTHLACAIASEVIGAFKSALFMTVLGAVRHIKDTYRKDSVRSESEAIDDLVAPGLLILDEVGVQVGSEHEKMLVFEIINERYQACRSTILISNLNREELTAYLGDRIMDRFNEAGAVVAFDWASYRGKAA
jgi:DNA replication protein DnaC